MVLLLYLCHFCKLQIWTKSTKPLTQVPCSFTVQCNVPCGNGTQRRDIICVQKRANDFSVAPASECAHLDKPAAVQACEMDECRPQWFTTEWSAVRGRWQSPHKKGNAVRFFTTMHISCVWLKILPLSRVPGSAHAPVERACR